MLINLLQIWKDHLLPKQTTTDPKQSIHQSSIEFDQESPNIIFVSDRTTLKRIYDYKK